MSKNYYEILGVNRDADENEIKKQYRKLCLKWHPDKHVGESEELKKEAEEKFKEINEAYTILSDPEKKKMYDTYGTVDMNAMGGNGFGPDIDEILKNMGGFNPFSNPFGDPFEGFRRSSRNTPKKAVTV